MASDESRGRSDTEEDKGRESRIMGASDQVISRMRPMSPQAKYHFDLIKGILLKQRMTREEDRLITEDLALEIWRASKKVRPVGK